MKTIYLKSFIIFLLMFCSCDSDESEISKIESLSKKHPQCVVDKIKTIYNKEFVGTTTIYKYSYNNEIVYEFDTKMGVYGTFSVINNSCETICGGDSGVIYHNTCIDWDKATLIETIWKDSR